MAVTTPRHGAPRGSDTRQIDIPSLQPTQRPPRPRRKAPTMPAFSALSTAVLFFVVVSLLPLADAVRHTMVVKMVEQIQDAPGVQRTSLDAQHAAQESNEVTQGYRGCVLLGNTLIAVLRIIVSVLTVSPLGIYQFRKLPPARIPPRCQSLALPPIHPNVRRRKI